MGQDLWEICELAPGQTRPAELLRNARTPNHLRRIAVDRKALASWERGKAQR